MLLDLSIIAVGVVYVIAGVISRRVLPRNRIGLLMAAVGCSWLGDYLFYDQAFPLKVASELWPAMLGHLVLAFPTGRLLTVPRRLVIAVAYLEVLVIIGLERYAPNSPADQFVDNAETVSTAVIGLVMLGLQVQRWTCSSVAQRRTLTSMLGASAVAVVVFAAWEPFHRAGMNPPVATLLLALAGIPVAYLAGLLRRRMDRGGVADLVVRLNDSNHRASVQEALATTLHDPGLRVGYWLAEQSRYVDAEGQPVTPAPGAVLTQVNRGGSPVALLVHDPVLLEDPELVDAACAAVGLALDNERLTAELRARLRQLAESRSKVVQAAESERRRLERDLHDGIQQRLLSVAMTLGLAETTDSGRTRQLTAEAKSSVLATIDDLRAVCNGIHPPVLTERGLHGAVRELTAIAEPGVDLTLDLARPLPPEVETTAYYVVAEALANVTKHAGATRTRVAISGNDRELVVEVDDDGCGGADPDAGSGLRGLTDRVEATGGTMRVISEVDEGTRLRVVLPCG